jgi:hypothetical protein
MIRADGVYIRSGKAHNHGEETDELERIAAVHECEKLAGERPGSLKDLCDEVRLR